MSERIFKRRLEPDESFADAERAALIADLAAMDPAEKAALPADLKKALRNELLLAGATAGYPPADEGFAARALRQMRSRRS
jgi:hypothetical protein